MNCNLIFRAAPRIVNSGFKSPDRLIWRRYESSFRRTKQRLRVKPDPSFKPTGQQDHIIFNPPSSAPSVYHTPFKFLPKGDRRRELYLNATTSPLHATSPGSLAGDSQPLPPPVRQPYEKRYHLTAEDIEEIRRLRTEDDVKWTRQRLAEKFNCSQFFVGLVVQASKGKLERDREALEAVKAKWGKKRKMAREDSARRRETWGKDE